MSSLVAPSTCFLKLRASGSPTQQLKVFANARRMQCGLMLKICELYRMLGVEIRMRAQVLTQLSCEHATLVRVRCVRTRVA